MIKYTAEQVEEAAKWIDDVAEAYHYPDEPWTRSGDMLRAYAALLREQELEAANRSKCRRFQSLMDDVDDD